MGMGRPGGDAYGLEMESLVLPICSSRCLGTAESNRTGRAPDQVRREQLLSDRCVPPKLALGSRQRQYHRVVSEGG
eukprot:6676330-Heterocapsa_arctica.AAC.1